MPGPYRAAAGKPPAVHKRPRRGQDPSLRSDPSTSAHTPPQVRAATHQRAATHVGGGIPDAPETFRHRPSPGKPPGRACPAPTARRWASPLPSINARGGVKTPAYGPTHQRVPAPTARRWASPMPSVNAHGGVKTPPYEPPHQRVPRPPAARRCGNGDKKTEAIPFPGTASVLYISA